MSGRRRASTGFEIVSPLDYRVKLHVDYDDEAYWVEYHDTCLVEHIEDMTITALGHGLTVDDEGDPYEMEEHIGYGFMRRYLVLSTGDETMPHLSQTAYGPLSGFMEACR